MVLDEAVFLKNRDVGDARAWKAAMEALVMGSIARALIARRAIDVGVR